MKPELGIEDSALLKCMQIEITEWQRKQFPDAELKGAGMHLLKECAEAAEELADVFFLASQCERLGGVPIGLPEMCWQAIKDLGLMPEQIIYKKLEKNRLRKWPSKPAADGCYHHTAEAGDDK